MGNDSSGAVATNEEGEERIAQRGASSCGVRTVAADKEDGRRLGCTSGARRRQWRGRLVARLLFVAPPLATPRRDHVVARIRSLCDHVAVVPGEKGGKGE